MPDDKKFDIKINTSADTTGAEEARRALEQVEDQAKETAQATSAQSNGFAGQLQSNALAPDPDTATRAAEAQERLNQATQEYRDTAPEVAAANDDISRGLNNVADDAPRASNGIDELNKKFSADVLSRAAGVFAAIGQQIATLGTSLKDVDPAAGKALESVGALASGIGDVASLTAQGFAVAGPWGAAIGAAAGAGKAALGPFIEDMQEQLSLAKQSVAAAEQMREKYEQVASALAKDNVGEYSEQLRKSEAAQRSFNDALQADIDLADQRRKGREQDIQNEIRLAQARIELQVQSGELTQAQADAQISALKAQTAATDAQAAIAQEQQRNVQAEAQVTRAKNAAEQAQVILEREQRNLATLTAEYERLNEIANSRERLASEAPESADARNAAAAARTDANIQSAAVGASQEKIEGFEARIAELDQSVQEALQAQSVIATSVAQAIEQIGKNAAFNDVIAKTDEIKEAITQQGNAATEALETAKQGIDAEVEKFRQAGQAIPATLATQQAEVIKLLNDSIRDALQIAEITRIAGELQKEQANFGNATIQGFAAQTAILTAQQNQINAINAQLRQLQETSNR